MSRRKQVVTDWLIVWLALAFGVAAIFPRARAEVILAFLPVCVVIVWFGLRRENGDGEFPQWSPARGILLLVLFLGVTCCVGPAAFYVINDEPFVPANSELLPLPDGLQATSNVSGRGWCGSGSCTRRFTVAGRAGQSSQDVSEQVRRHLSRKGWDLGDDGSECRPAGHFFDQTTICVELYVDDGAVIVHFTGNRAGA